MTSSRRLLASLALSLAVLAPARALAQPRAPSAQELETARTLYKEGKELRARGDLRGALEKLQAAHALGNTPVTGIELARTYVLVGRLVEAREVSLYIARIPVASDETEKSAEARTEAATLAEQLRPRIPTLVVKVQGLAAGESAHMAIDGAAVPDAAFGEPQKVNPGKHEVVVRAGEGAAGREARGEVDAPEGQTAELALTVPPAPASPPPPPPPETPHPPARGSMLVKIGFGTAIAGGAVSLLAGITAMTKKGQLAGECNASLECDTAHGGSQDLATARTWANVSTAAFAVGGIGAVVGIVGLITSKGGSDAHDAHDEARLSPWIGVGTAGVHGRF
jgi:hypothetical protein